MVIEVASGGRPIQPTEDANLVDWVFTQWLRGEFLEARDPNLGTEYIAEEMELVLKLGLMCSHSDPAARPSMRQVMQFLERGCSSARHFTTLSFCWGPNIFTP